MLDIRDKRFLGQGMFAWLFLPLVALFNIFLRDGVIIPLVGPELAVPISTVVLLVMLYATAYFLLSGVERPTSCGISFLLGVIWVAFAIVFEALFVVFGLNQPLSELWKTLSLPAVLEGNLFLVVLAMLFLAPAICASKRLRG
ncbi:MAG: hypothetical protein L3J67_05945 [Hyphomicrobiaceae bacterium]|nr:hypothetical protein [Hyphomicrobiaceae bacterium]